MKGALYFIKRFIQNLFYLVLGGGLLYSLLAVCQWELWIGDWFIVFRIVYALIMFFLTIITFDSIGTSWDTACSMNEVEKRTKTV